jgi:serine/threonine-protein kinase
MTRISLRQISGEQPFRRATYQSVAYQSEIANLQSAICNRPFRASRGTGARSIFPSDMIGIPDRLRAALADRYMLERPLGQGGMATVYLAHDVRHNRKVAVKVLRPELAAAIGAERFLREIEVTANLQHPHILPLFDSGEAAGFLFFVMPYVEDESLRTRLDRDGALPLADAIRLMREVADALAYAHARGIVHRDIKPDNVMVSGRHALVTDFGVARAVSAAAGSEGLTTAGMAVGTPVYMAPEQATGDPDIDHRADLYALGVMGYELLAGKPPFTDRTPRQILAAHLHEQARPVTELRTDTPSGLAAVVTRCLEKAPGDRWQRADDIVARLEALETPGGGTGVVRAIRRRPRALIAALLGAAGAAALLALALLHGPTAEPAASSSTALAVFPFSVRGGPDVQYLGEGIVNLLATSLDGAAGLRSVDPRALIARVHRQELTAIAPDRASDIAEELGAGLYILGDIVQAGDQIHIDASLYDRRRGARPVGRGTADGPPSDVLAMVDRLAAQLLASGIAAEESRVAQIAAVTTHSLSALKKYLEGEGLFRAGHFGPAVEAFQAAVAADSQFALAFYRLSVAAEWALRPDVATAAAEGAVRHAERLSEHDRQLLEALLTQRRGEHQDAEQMFRAIIAIWPQDVEAWLQLGEVLFHYGPIRGDSLEASAPVFARVLALEPDNVASLIHLQRIAAFTGDAVSVDTLGRRILQLTPDGERSAEAAGFVAASSGDAAKLAAFRDEMQRLPDIRVPQAVFGPAIWTDAFADFRPLFEVETSPSRSNELRALGHVHLAYLDAMRGRWEAATTELAKAEALDHAKGLEHRAWLTLLPFAPITRTDLEHLRDALADWNAGGVPRSAIPSAHFAIHNDRHADIRLYLLGLVHARLGETAQAAALVRQLERPTGDGATTALRTGFARSIQAQLAEARGDQAGALRAIEQIRIGNYEPALFSPFLSGASERFRRAALQEGLGLGSDATRGYGSFEGVNFFSRVLAGPAHLRLGRIAEAAGRVTEARAHYQRFLFLWSDADPEFRPLIEEAEAALVRLRGREG